MRWVENHCMVFRPLLTGKHKIEKIINEEIKDEESKSEKNKEKKCKM